MVLQFDKVFGMFNVKKKIMDMIQKSEKVMKKIVTLDDGIGNEWETNCI